MSFWSRVGAAWRGFKSADGNGPYGSLAPFIEVYNSGRATRSGETVNWSTALQVSVVAGITRVLCDGIAQVPLKLYRERADGRGSDPATDHPLYPVLYRRPNPWQTSFAFRETMMLHLILCGNFFALKNVAGGQVRELVPIEPGRVEVEQLPDMTLRYWVRNQRGDRKEVPAEAIWHVRGPSWNSWMGMEAVKIARESIGLTMAIEGDQAKLYRNGLRTSGTYSVEGKLSPEQYKDLRKYIKEWQSEQGGPLILDMAAKYLQQTMTGVDAQTLESRRLQVEEVCRPFRVMPIMVGHADKTATYASAEQMFIAHVVHTLAPWCQRIEQAIDNDLLDAERDRAVYAKFNLNGLMRGAFKDRMEGYARMLGAGGSPPMAEVNELRAMEEMNPVDWGDGKPEPAQAAAPTKPPAEPPEGDE
jgi:HK97 family phage portal protein